MKLGPRLGHKTSCAYRDGEDECTCSRGEVQLPRTDQQLIVDLQSQLAASQAMLEKARADSWCDVCVGNGDPGTGVPCICGGTGRASDATVSLRKLYTASQAECERLRAAADGAENALRCCPALKEWRPSTPEHLTSRVATLCNLYDGTMYTITLLDELEQKWKQATGCASPEEAGKIILQLRRRIHFAERHNQMFERCESAWCHPGPDDDPAREAASFSTEQDAAGKEIADLREALEETPIGWVCKVIVK